MSKVVTYVPDTKTGRIVKLCSGPDHKIKQAQFKISKSRGVFYISKADNTRNTWVFMCFLTNKQFVSL